MENWMPWLEINNAEAALLAPQISELFLLIVLS
jgi:hypothetical protein